MLLPAVHGLAGIFLSESLRASLVIDYQNVHLTARDVFDPGGDAHHSLIHPMLLAETAVAERNDRQRPGHPAAQVARVSVFRGLPHVDHDGDQHRRCLDQAARWRRDGAAVRLRDLKYRYVRDSDGRDVLDDRGITIPVGRPKEKGIDVLCALAAVNESERSDVDVVILLSRDTDLVPVLDELYDRRGRSPELFAAIETASWLNRQARAEGAMSGGSLKPSPPRRIWNTNLGRPRHEASLDRNIYR